MSKKRRDTQGRWRNKMIAFRVSPEEDNLIEAVVKMLGISKQEYLTANMLKHTIKMTPSPRMIKGLKSSLHDIIEELKRIGSGEKIESDMLFTINTALDIILQTMEIKDKGV